MRKLLVFFCLFTAFTAVSSAGITASLDGGAPAAVGPGIYRYTYTAVLESDVLEAGDYFVIYDFLGYRAGSITAPNVNWTTDDSGTIGPYPSSAHSESAAVVNLLWVYEGANLSAAGGPVVLGKFSADFQFEPGRTAFRWLALPMEATFDFSRHGGRSDPRAFYDGPAGGRSRADVVRTRRGRRLRRLSRAGRDRGNMKSVECRSRPCLRALNKSETVPSRFTRR